MKIFFLLISFVVSQISYTQIFKLDYYVAAKSGLSIRKSPSLKSPLVKKIAYGDKVEFMHFDYTSDSTTIVDGFPCQWMMIKQGKDSGYVVDAFMFPIPPPSTKHQTIEDYIRSISKPIVDSLKFGDDNPRVEESIDITYKSIFKNGVEIIKRQCYEYGSATYILPSFDSRKAFQLLRLIENEDSTSVEKNDDFPIKNKVITRNKECKVSIFTDTKKDTFLKSPWHILFSLEFENFAETEIIELENQSIITIRYGN
jgi:hypothetical protein